MPGGLRVTAPQRRKCDGWNEGFPGASQVGWNLHTVFAPPITRITTERATDEGPLVGWSVASRSWRYRCVCPVGRGAPAHGSSSYGARSRWKPAILPNARGRLVANNATQ